MHLDDIDFIRIKGQNTSFPMHFHETFCISYIHNGLEQIQFTDHTTFCQSASISITNPFEVHANPLVDKDNKVSFDTIYLSKDLMSYLSGYKEIYFKQRIITSPLVNSLFHQLIYHLQTQQNNLVHTVLKQFINAILPFASKGACQEITASILKQNHTLVEYIDNHLQDRLTLDSLASVAAINKYSLVRDFKTQTGLTPMHYMHMKKIYACKEMLFKNTPIEELVHDYNFTDMAHFSKSFKNFIGLSPRAYLKQVHLED
ncbi:AraC family transcriptional regulator [Myroides sp. LJL116]